MASLQVISDPRVAAVFERYPAAFRPRMLRLRQLILDAATAAGLPEIEETLKWGEPSYLAKKGSTVRIDWKSKAPEQYAVYFKCTSKLMESFREVYKDTFNYEGNRAIVFQLNDDVPEEELKRCIGSALRYHTVKQLDRLGL